MTETATKILIVAGMANLLIGVVSSWNRHRRLRSWFPLGLCGLSC